MDLHLSLRTTDNPSKEGLEITRNLGEFFYADITTDSNATSSVTKDFIISYGKHDDVTNTFRVFYSYILRNQVIPVGISTTTITCQASGAGSYDCIGGIGTYNPQTGGFILENGITVLDVLYILGSSVTDAYFAPPLDCTNPAGYPDEVRCGCAACGQDPTHKYKCMNGSWVDLGYYSDCDVTGCSNPDGTEGQIVECGVGYDNQPFIDHKYQCTNGIWVDQGYNPNCVSPDATIIMEDANIPIGGSDAASILITNVTNLGSVDAHVLYDPNVVSIKSILCGDDFDNLIPSDDGNGDLTLIAYTMGSINGNAKLCDITFEPAPGVSVNDTCPLNLSGTLLLDATPQSTFIPHNIVNGIATIIASAFRKVKNGYL
jgi:hypothetical protein